jgi:CDP-glycerol glycerophosphotransferase (TagB/SpsB family)
VGNEVLIAPSWNYNQKNFINENLEEIIEAVLQKGHIVKFRPHPESFKRSMLTINYFKKKFSNKNFSLDETSENINSMENAKCLITDSSGIAIEFVLLFKKPILYFEDNDKVHNVEFSHYNDLITMDQKVKEKFGYTFKKGNIKDLDVLINKSTSEFIDKDVEIKKFINNNFYNYGTTAKNFNDLINKGF